MVKKILENIYNYAFTFFLILFATIIVSSYYSSKTGIDMFIVKSGSMEPTIPTGSIIITKKQNFVQIGDIVTFHSPNIDKIPVTHRIIDIKKDSNSEKIYTQGDANNGPDLGNIKNSDIIGTLLFHIPYVGYIVSISRNPYALAILLFIPASILLISEFKKKNQNQHEQ